ncbi:CYTH domain-containing protein [Candidatus Gracilibacteria bacterium]|nr:CYTH domain-containing protein [Candidatus Gracilibacteria bacterium]
MQIEYEATFLDVDKDEIRKQLIAIGAKCIFEERLMKRVVFKVDKNPDHEFVRVRDEGDKVTCTYKSLTPGEGDIASVKELETQVGDFDIMKNILLSSGLTQKAYQETLRENWELEGVEFMIDTWPGLHTFIEIEANNEKLVKDYSQKLGFDYSQAVFGTVGAVYLKELGLSRSEINSIPVITFDDPPKGKKQHKHH